jgi:REP element-mobilizing transposase RayT
MARKARIEYENAYYHVINRGNFRSWIFETAGARKSFLECLMLTCVAKNWLLHGWCLMGNHYHLLIQTPDGNLIDGMRWLQSTFANRFNRFRGVNGHVFQGRYKAILLDMDAIGPVAHYIHLNPVRAGLVGADQLESFESSSFHQLWFKKKRWSFGVFECCLDAAGGLADTPKGRRLYRDYLNWLTIEEGEQKRLGFESMCKGWAKGTKDFKRAVMEDTEDSILKQVVESETKEMREPYWERILARSLSVLDKTGSDLKSDRKGAPWKVTLARYLRESYLIPNAWLAESLHMGTPNSLSSQISRQRKLRQPNGSLWTKLKNQENVD